MLVSILIPAYNAESWIADCITSALNQTWPRKEVIIVDDGSSDDTLAIVRRFESRTVKVLSQENRGASAARNNALSFAQGDYIQWLDADNLLAPDKISRQMTHAALIGNKKVLLSSAWGRFFYRTGKAHFQASALWSDMTALEWLYRKLDENLWMVPETWLVSRELTEAAGPWDEGLSLDDDGEYFARVINACEHIRFIPRARSYYRSGIPGSLSSVAKRPDKKLRSQFRSMRAHIDLLLAMENSVRTRTACIKFLQRWLIYFYPEMTDIVQEARALARDLGGALQEPELKRKYAMLLPFCGWRLTKHLYFSLPNLKVLVRRNVDRALYSLQPECDRKGPVKQAAYTDGLKER